jgi:hypothetical protein
VEYNDENIMYLVSTDTNLQLGFSWTFFKTHNIEEGSHVQNRVNLLT